VFFINPENENQNNLISFKSFTKRKFLSIKPNKTQMPCTISKKKVKNLNLYSHKSRTKDKKKTNKLPCNYQENNITNKPKRVCLCVQIREKEKGYYLKEKMGKDEGVCQEGVFVEILGFILPRRFCQSYFAKV